MLGKCLVFVACTLTCALLNHAAWCQLAPQQADSLTGDKLVCALNPRCGHTVSPGRHRRGLTISEPDAPERIAPAFFNSITFEFDSVELTTEARNTLDRIGEALQDPSIRALNYRIEGHTDAKGSAPYNQLLSERRAQAVRNYLITKHNINENRLLAIGFGKTQPLPDPPAPSPYAAINRRVQFTLVPPPS